MNLAELLYHIPSIFHRFGVRHFRYDGQPITPMIGDVGDQSALSEIINRVQDYDTYRGTRSFDRFYSLIIAALTTKEMQ